MENHGPLHLEKIAPEETARLLGIDAPSGMDELGVYLRHVRNAGAMAKALCTSLATQQRPGLLCWYGDHVPIMPEVYARSGFDDPRTDYFIWHTANRRMHGSASGAVDLAAADLAAALLNARASAVELRPERNPRRAS
jgi:hypothetical protein